MNKYDMYITFIFIVKIGFIILAITHLYLKAKGKDLSPTDKKVLYWKERLEFVFVALMSALLIYLFNPRSNRSAVIDGETKLLLYLFGFILLITAKWEIFFSQAKWAKQFLLV